MKRKREDDSLDESKQQEKKQKTTKPQRRLRTKFVDNLNRRKWLVLDYLQKQVKKDGFKSGSFWHHLDYFTDSNNETLVLVDSKDPDALAGYICGNIDEGRIELIEVNPEYRRLGVGKNLVEEFARVCDSELDEIWAAKVLSTAQSFWESLGFRWRRRSDWSCPREDLYHRVQTRSMASRSNR